MAKSFSVKIVHILHSSCPSGVVCLVFFPFQEILLFRLDSSVLQPLGIIAGKNELHRAEKPLVELQLLVEDVLTG